MERREIVLGIGLARAVDGRAKELNGRPKVRDRFPLHYIIFKQVSSHLAHEGNTEQLFSRSGALSDDNGKMDAARLAVWTAIGVNRSVCQPTHRQILERYLLNFSKGSKVHEDDLGLLDDAGDGSDAVADVTEDGSYFARYGEPPPERRLSLWPEHEGVSLGARTVQGGDSDHLE